MIEICKIALLLFAFIANAFTANAQVVLVTKVKDGDTIEILENGINKWNVRLAEIDAPEKTQEFGPEAKAHLEKLVLGAWVTLKCQTVDLYGRHVCVVEAKDLNVNEDMVANGYAWHYAQYSKSTRLAELQKSAQALKRGLWSSKRAQNPAEFRKENGIGHAAGHHTNVESTSKPAKLVIGKNVHVQNRA